MQSAHPKGYNALPGSALRLVDPSTLLRGPRELAWSGQRSQNVKTRRKRPVNPP